MPAQPALKQIADYGNIRYYAVENNYLKDEDNHSLPIGQKVTKSNISDIQQIKSIEPSDNQRIDIPFSIKKAINDAKRILLLQDNWDDEGAKEISPKIFKRVTYFLENYSERVFDVCGKDLIVPDIVPVPDGSIDLEWNLENSYFLINFKNTEEELAFYYGEFRDNNQVVFDANGQISTKAINDKFAAYLFDLSKEENPI